jgi:hypothetical protein
MKQETKELLDYIIRKFDSRQHIGDFLTEKEKVDARRFNENQQKIQDFLRSIPDIEKHLTEGGYIQDRNGTPICHGDKIKLCIPCVYDDLSEEAYRHAVLNWNSSVAKFEVIYENDDQSVVTAALSIFTPQMLEKED